ncbi:M13 family metallopeptidase [Mycoplasma sp. 128]
MSKYDANKLKIDFYEEINKEWMEKTQIKPDRTSAGSFVDIYDKVEEQLKELFFNWKNDEKSVPNDSKIQNFVKFFKMSLDWNKRQELGIKPILPLLAEIEKLHSFKDVFENYRLLVLKGLYVPVEFDVEADFKNSKKQVLFVFPNSLILGSTKPYQEEERKTKLLDAYEKMAIKLLAFVGKSEQDAKQMVQKAFAFDKTLLPLSIEPEYAAVYTNFYNPTTLEELKTKSSKVNLAQLIEQTINKKPEMVVVGYPKFVNEIDTLLSDDNFENYKARLYIATLVSYSAYLSDELRIIAGEFRRAFTGSKEAESQERIALLSSLSFFKMPVGTYYGLHFFGPEAKADVEHLTKSMIEIYKKRLAKNTWLSKDTINMALKKLDTMEVSIGYPDEIESYYDLMKTKTYEEGSNLLENVLNFVELKTAWVLNNVDKDSNNKLWSMSPSEVNAYFSPTQNKIVFPAAILQAPFYSLEQTSSQNFGGIGVVIAHEISHAFDNNGANFDENGNMVNWWTDEDRKNFEQKAQGIIAQFDGVETFAGKCNGKLVVSENIADNGGVACAYEAAKLKKDFNAKEFMINYATIWRAKYLLETAKNLLQTDVHAPTKLRANIQLANMDDFYKEFDITEDDPMYMSPEKRVNIW